MDAGQADIGRPDLAVDRGMVDRDLVELRRFVHLLGGQVPSLHGLRLAIEFHDAALIHQAHPEIAVGVEFEIELALRIARPVERQRIFLQLAGLGIEASEIELAEIRIPDHAVGIDQHVVRLDFLPRQIVFGDDRARAAAFDARQCLQRIFPFRRRAEIDAGEIGGGVPDLRTEAAGIGLGHALLHVRVRGHVGVARHAHEHLQPLLGCV